MAALESFHFVEDGELIFWGLVAGVVPHKHNIEPLPNGVCLRIDSG
jgi:hypothetical protein